MKTVIDTFPAFDVVERTETKLGVQVFRSGDKIAVKGRMCRGQQLYNKYSLGSAASYALKCNQCPIKAYNRCVELGHETHWANQEPTGISSRKAAVDLKPSYCLVEFGQVILFEGRKFKVAPANNENVKLVEVE